MNNNVLVMREEEMEQAVSGLNKLYADTNDTSGDIGKKFKCMKITGDFGNGINIINQQYNSIAESIFNIDNMMKRHSKEMFEFERAYANSANQIEVPQDFVKNDSRAINSIDDIVLNKNDGRSVNEGQALHSIDEISDNTVVKEDLNDITSKLNVKEEKLDENTIINKTNIANINNENGKVEQKLDESTIINNVDMSNIKNSNNLEVQKVDEHTNIVGGEINDTFNRGQLQQQNIDTSRYENLDEKVEEEINAESVGE